MSTERKSDTYLDSLALLGGTCWDLCSLFVKAPLNQFAFIFVVFRRSDHTRVPHKASLLREE